MKKSKLLPIDSLVESLTTELRKVDTALTKRETATQEAAAQQQAAQEAAQAAASRTTLQVRAAVLQALRRQHKVRLKSMCFRQIRRQTPIISQSFQPVKVI